ncbi:MAG: heavy-metal-associated domain-containing protein [Bacteroidia bacterium]|nr:heavy-metal-associated domain-containing protein [Bacteroidia bacterium]
MKTKILFSFIALLIIYNANAQETTSEIKIKTSATCDMCKETIEKYVAFEKGVKKVTVDVDTKMATVIYNPQKTSPEKIRLAISKSGYDADNIPADKKAYDKLDACCKKGQVCTDKK